MKRILPAGERYGLFRQDNSLHPETLNRPILHPKTYRNGWLIALCFPKVIGTLLLVAFTCFLYRTCLILGPILTGNSLTPSRSRLEGLSKPSRRIVEHHLTNSPANPIDSGFRYWGLPTSIKRFFSCNLSGVRKSIIHFCLFFIYIQAAIANESVPKTNQMDMEASDLTISLPVDTITVIKEVPRISVGMPLPEEFWTTEFQIYDDEELETKTLESYRGKALILDFWSTTCTPCISSFPFLNQLRVKYIDRFDVLLVNAIVKDDFFVIQQRLKKLGDSYKLPTIIGDNFLKHMFPHQGIPHYIWIDKFGRVDAISTTLLLNEINIKKLAYKYEK